ncbi:hypothetical protein DYGSA30_04610 [Dyella sp. GSA-30]|nr:hypothetical protein DYGSA30_04610 [Dyella sp. GSA-30]
MDQEEGPEQVREPVQVQVQVREPVREPVQVLERALALHTVRAMTIWIRHHRHMPSKSR